MTHKLISEINKASLRSDIPEFRVGDSLRVHVKVVEGNKSRVQVFAGVVIARVGSAHRDLHGAQGVLWHRR